MAAFKSACISAFLLSLCVLSASQSSASPETLQILRNIETSIDQHIDPCDDFYEYACGNFKDVPDEAVSTSLITLATDNFDNAISDILERDFASQPHHQSAIDKVGIFFQSCNDEQDFELIRYLDEIKPATGVEWPLLEELYAGAAAVSSWPAHKVHIMDLIANLHSYGVSNILFNFAISGTYELVTFQSILPDADDLQPKDVDIILKDFRLPYDKLAKYRNEILQVHSELKSIGKHVQAFEILEADEFQRAHPILTKLYEVSMPHIGQKYSHYSFASKTQAYEEYLAGKQWTNEEKRRFCNFIMFMFLKQMYDYNQNSCKNEVRTKFQFAVEYLYYEYHYLPQAEENNEKMSEIIRNIYTSFLDVVNENRMKFNETQMEYIEERIEDTTFNIGNLPPDVNLTTVEEFYKDLPAMDINNYYKNDLLILKHAHSYDDTRRNVPLWSYFRDIDITPYNDKLMAKVVIPFANTALPAFHPQLDDLFVLSGLGFYLGHEITHTIDHDIWKKMAIKLLKDDPRVKEALDCLASQQPSNFMQERVSDLVGTRTAYNAYNSKHTRQPYYTSIPWEKLFFLNLAQTFCSKLPDTDSTHDAMDVRIRQIAKNSEEFAKAFECPVGSQMNPVKKCHFY